MSSTHESSSSIDVMGEIPSLLGSISKALLKGVPLLPAFLLLFGAIGYFAAEQMDEEFEARAEIIMLSKRLEDERAIITGSQRSLVLPPATQDLISETHILRSITLIEQTLSSLSGVRLVKGQLTASNDDPADAQPANSGGEITFDDAASFEDAVFQIADNLTVRIEPGSAIISITLIHTNPEFAVRFIDAHLDNYFKYRTDLTQDNSQIEFLTERVDALQEELAQVNDQRRAALNLSAAIDPEAEADLNWQTMRDELNRIGIIETQLRDLEASLRLQSSTLRLWETSGPYDMPISANGRNSNTGRPGDATSYLIQLQSELAEARNRFNDTSDVVVEAQQQFQAAKNSFVNSLRQEVIALEQNVQALRSESAQKRTAIAALRSKNESLSNLSGELSVLDTRLANIQLNFTTALTSLENAQSVSASSSSLASVRVLQQASLTSLEPVSPNKGLFVASGAALGFFLCLLLALILFTRPPRTA